jgi:hypothetical protein
VILDSQDDDDDDETMQASQEEEETAPPQAAKRFRRLSKTGDAAAALMGLKTDHAAAASDAAGVRAAAGTPQKGKATRRSMYDDSDSD